MMRKLATWLLLPLCGLLLLSCTQRLGILTQIIDIDNPNSPLRIHFSFKQIPDTSQAQVHSVNIYRQDTLAYQLRTKGKLVSNWTFPDLGEDWEIVLPFDLDTLPTFSKNESLRFDFRGIDRFTVYGNWAYSPDLVKPEHRWLFDTGGTQQIQVLSTYEPWVGRDVVRIVGDANLSILPNSIQLREESGIIVPIEVQKVDQPMAHYILLIKENYPQDTELTLRFQTGLEQQYQRVVRVPDRSVMGLLGKRR